MEEKQLNMPDEHPVPKKKRKGKAGRILLLLILILVAGAAIGYYFYERSQPAKELDKYLTGIQSLDFDTMESMLQSADLSALDNACAKRHLRKLLQIHQCQNDLEDHKDTFQFSRRHCRSHCADPLCRRI